MAVVIKLLVELLRQGKHRLELEITAKQIADGFRIFRIAHKFSIFYRISEWDPSSHVHALLAGCGNLVADTLRRDLTFELGEGQQC